ncbi:hypothetical protein V6N13_020123 [Hibiscus sabdariffa]
MRFTVLASLNIREFSLVVPKERPMAQQSGSKDNGMKTSSSNLVVVPSNIFLRNATFTASNIKEKAKASNKFTLKATVVPSVVGQVANIVDHGTKISSRKQSTVTIVEQGDMKSALLGGKGVKPRLNNTGKILKKDTKRGKRIRKPIDIFPTTRVVFGERIQNISSQLDSIVVSDTLDSGVSPQKKTVQHLVLNPESNSDDSLPTGHCNSMIVEDNGGEMDIFEL